MIFNISNNKPSIPFTAPLYTFEGTKPEIFYDPEDEDNWEIVFYGDCDITFTRLSTPVDLWLVGGGQSGKSGSGNLAEAKGGDGGKGGACVSALNKQLQIGKTYQVRPGASDSSTTFSGPGVNVSAATAGGSAGGTGALHSTLSSTRTAATAGTAGSTAWSTNSTLHWPGYKYGAGGGGGSAYSTLGGDSSAAANGGQGWIKPNVGEQRSGGDGGSRAAGTGGYAGGGGGGGASYHWNTSSPSTDKNYGGGKGGKGIVKMRNHRT